MWADWKPPGPIPREPEVEPLFPIQSFIPIVPCPHHGPLPDGSKFVCMVCGEGSPRFERHGALVITPKDLKILAQWEEDHPQPTKYGPDPDGLKGGVG